MFLFVFLSFFHLTVWNSQDSRLNYGSLPPIQVLFHRTVPARDSLACRTLRRLSRGKESISTARLRTQSIFFFILKMYNKLGLTETTDRLLGHPQAEWFETWIYLRLCRFQWIARLAEEVIARSAVSSLQSSLQLLENGKKIPIYNYNFRNNDIFEKLKNVVFSKHGPQTVTF